MPKLRLTSASVEKLKPPSQGQAEYFDELLPSFGLRISYRGTRSWFVTTRIHGKLKRMTLGRFPAISLSEARQIAREFLNNVANGQVTASPTSVRLVEQMTYHKAVEKFLTVHVQPNLKPNTQKEYDRILHKVTAHWHQAVLKDIDKSAVRGLIDDTLARTSPSNAKHLHAYLSKFFGWCVDREYLDVSPADRIVIEGGNPSRERYLSVNEIPPLLKSFKDEGYPFGDLFMVLLLTGQRRSECAAMAWDELQDLDGERPTLVLPAERTKNKRPHIVPLSAPVAGIIRQAPVIGPYVFTTTGNSPVSGFSKAKRTIDSTIADECRRIDMPDLKPWRLHDLRRTMVTLMNEELRIPPHVVEAVVNHVSGLAKSGVAGVYNRALYLDERREALNQWAAFLQRIG